MAYKNLTTQTMITITGAWVDKDQERPIIESLPQARALLLAVEKAHRGLCQLHSTGEKAGSELSTLQQEEGELDKLHDRKARGLHSVLTGFADLADDPADADAYIRLRDLIFPHGVKVIIWSYTDEASEAKLADERLTPEDRALLKQLPSPNGRLIEAHAARVRAGQALGELERRRISLAAKTEEAPGATQEDDVRARNAWIRAVTAFVATLDLEESLTEAHWERILAPLREAELRAARRGSSAA